MTRTKTTSPCERTVSPEIKWIIMSDNLNYFYERAENHKAKERMFKPFKLMNFPGKHPDAGVDQ